LLLGYWLSTRLVRMLSGNIRDLAKAGESLLDESKFHPVVGPISEINTVQRYLSRVIERRRVQQVELARLASITLAAHDALIGVDGSGRIEVWNAGAERLFGYAHSEVIGQSVEMLVPEPARASHASGLSSVLQGQPVEPYDTERLHKSGQLISVSISMRPILSKEGETLGIAKAVYDLTDRKRYEARQQLLLRELAHRVKNIFAVLQSVLRLSLRTTFNPATFAEDFAGRIQSMGKAHDILTAGDWQSVELDGLVGSQLRPYLSDRRPRIVVSGEKVMLPPDLAVPLGLALHELATNAAKYGALSVTNGRVRLSWTVRREGSDCEVTLIWQENGGPPVTPPTRTGFGSTLIEDGIPGATVERNFEPAGVVCTMVIRFAEPK
jgi:PAS domain S-box-containing protein